AANRSHQIDGAFLGHDLDEIYLELGCFDAARLDLRGDQRVAGTAGHVGNGTHYKLVLHYADLRVGAHELLDVGFGAFDRNLAGQQDDAIETGHIDVEVTFEALRNGKRRLVLDDIVVELCASGATVGGDGCGADGGRANHRR